MLTDAPQQFASILVDCLDLVGMEHSDPITMFADSTTTAGYADHMIRTHVHYFILGVSRDLLAGSVARLGSELAAALPHLGYLRDDSQDMERIWQEFCLVLADSGDGGRMRRLEVLETNTPILGLLAEQQSIPTLLLHTRNQNHHLEGQRMEESPYVQPKWTKGDHTLTSCQHPAPSTSTLGTRVVYSQDQGVCRPLSPIVKIKHVPPKVAKRSLEEYFTRVKKRVQQQLSQESSDWDEDTGCGHAMVNQYRETSPEIEDIDTPRHDAPQQAAMWYSHTPTKSPSTGSSRAVPPPPQAQKAKKGKRWCKKLGLSHFSTEHGVQEDKGQDGAEHQGNLKSPKSKKRWSFRSSRKRKSKNKQQEKLRKKKEASLHEQHNASEQLSATKAKETAEQEELNCEPIMTRNASFP